tara:strand:+ start:2062 stop:2787 length:726 start_codon:yes stop_codon:yes gene_type:complete
MESKEPHIEDLGEIIIETKLERSNKLKNSMKEGVDFGKIQGKTSDFLWVGGAAKLAEEFGLNAILKELIEEPYGEEGIKITTILDIVDEDDKVVGSGVGTWDTSEPLGNRPGNRQRGMAMSFKRAYVLGIRYASNSFGIFSQDDDVVRYADQPVEDEWKPNQVQNEPKQYDPNAAFIPCKEDENGVWRVAIGGKGEWANYPGKELIDIVRNDEGWANWCLKKPNLDSKCKEAIEDAATGKL